MYLCEALIVGDIAGYFGADPSTAPASVREIVLRHGGGGGDDGQALTEGGAHAVTQAGPCQLPPDCL